MFVADILIVYLVRAVIQLFRSQRSKSWPFVKGKIKSSQEVKGSTCHLAELTYSYRVDGELYTGTLREPFLVGSASDFVGQYPPGTEVIIRVNPGSPEVSFVRDKDLYLHAHGYRLES